MNWSEKFHKLDRLVASGISKVGFKEKGIILDSSNENYWTSIIERWQVLRVINVLCYLPYGLFIASFGENLRYMNPLLFGLPFSIFIFITLVCFNVEIVLYGFQRGREQKKGRTEINGKHICKIVIFPAFFSICILITFIVILIIK